MNKNILLLFVSLLCFFHGSSLFSQEIAECNHSCGTHTSIITNTSNQEKDQIVYICMGPYARAYHSTNSCPGLNNCSVKPVSMVLESQAQNNHGRRPCCRCWNNVYGNCAEDTHSSGGSGGGGDAEALGIIMIAVAAVIVVAGVALISNEIQVSPAMSFHRLRNYNGVGLGSQIQFRKTFNRSALEYGITFFNHPSYLQFGGHFSYVHNIFDTKMPTPRMKVFVGPTLKIMNNQGVFGIGGIVGTSYKLLDWLHADFRYELTNQSNHFQLGLRFRYQKEYFWKNKKLF